jgi:hypothetical protein
MTAAEKRMNDAARENPIPAPTAPEAIECPQCGTQLRMLRPATIHTPIACCICGATFYLKPIETAPISDTAIRPRRMVNTGPGTRPMFRVVSPPSRLPAERAPGDPPPAMSTPAPPPPSPGTRFAPGMPRPVELPDHVQRGFRTRWMESVLGAALVLLIVVAVCAGGFMLIKSIWGIRSTAPTPAAEEGGPAEDPNAQPPASTDPANPDAPVTEHSLGAKPLPRPDNLIGTWESRVDDGSTSSFVFRPDGRLTLTQAGDPPPPPSDYTWYLAARQGEDLVLEVGPAFGTMNNARLTLRLTSPDAFTLVKHIRGGIVQGGVDLRYVRTSHGAAAAPFVGPPAPPS